jgi:hypothetical protein
VTPQKVDIPEVRRDDRLSTSDLAAVLAEPIGSTPTPANVQEPNVPLFAQNDTQDFRSRWEKVQIGFVDEPRKAVEQADELVASAIKQLAEVFATERHKLEAEWEKTDNVSTEELRIALRRYRSFFDRLLSV